VGSVAAFVHGLWGDDQESFPSGARQTYTTANDK
jgi:hypothetical protein